MSHAASSAGEGGPAEPSASAGEGQQPVIMKRSLSPEGTSALQAVKQAKRDANTVLRDTSAVLRGLEIAEKVLQSGAPLQFEDHAKGVDRHVVAPKKADLISPEEQAALRDPQRLSERQDPALFWVVVDGPIGCGKTTFLDQLGELMGVEVVVEPVARDVRDSWHDALVKLYEWLQEREAQGAFPGNSAGGIIWEVEKMIWRHHFKNATRPRKTHLLTERSYEPKVYVFARVLCRKGLLDPDEFGAFAAAYEEVARDPKHKPDLILKFNVRPVTAKDRIDARADREDRVYEKNINLEYLEDLTQEYDHLYHGRIDVVEVDAEEATQEMITEVYDKVRHYIQDRCPEGKKEALHAFLRYLPHQ